MCMWPFNLDQVDFNIHTFCLTKSLVVDFLHYRRLRLCNQLLLEIPLLVVCDQ